MDFLEQIRLEVQLHREFKLKLEVQLGPENSDLPASVVHNDFQAFMQNAHYLNKLNGKAKKANRWKMFNCFVPEQHSKQVGVGKSEFAFHVCFFQINLFIYSLN
jgi:hypothetical protein